VGGITVVGSANLDLIGLADRLPLPGETVMGHRFTTSPGGKGANQAVACARLGAATSIVGRVGDDAFGEQVRANLRRQGVDTARLTVDPETATGVALIAVDAQGNNSILVAPGANARLTAEEAVAALHQSPPAAVLLQLEIPLTAVVAAARAGRALGARVVLNPAPAQPLPDELLSLVDILTPNEGELAVLAGRSVAGTQARRSACRDLLAKGVGTVIVTLGAAGALLATPTSECQVPGFAVQPVDTTGAGDAFNGAICVALLEGRSLVVAVRFANATGALATMGVGAQQALPTRAAVADFLAAHLPDWQQV
jgi:ribokinase